MCYFQGMTRRFFCSLPILFIMFVWGCSKIERVKIGAILELTGEGASYGQDAKRGIDIAVTEINESGGVNGKKIEIIYEDTQAKPALAASATQKLVTQDRVPVIVGALYSSGTLSAAPIAEKSRVVLFSPGSSSPEITKAGNYIFRNWISDIYEGSDLARFA